MKRYKDNLKENPKKSGLQLKALCEESLDSESRGAPKAKKPLRSSKLAIRVAALETKRAARKQSALPSSDVAVCQCSRCSRICPSRIGLVVHNVYSRMMSQYVVFDSAVISRDLVRNRLLTYLTVSFTIVLKLTFFSKSILHSFWRASNVQDVVIAMYIPIPYDECTHKNISAQKWADSYTAYGLFM